MSEPGRVVARALGARLLDLRTAVPAAIAWSGSAVLVGAPEAAVAVVAVAGVLAAVGTAVLALHSRSGSGDGGAPWVGAVASLVVTGMLLLGLVAVSVAVGQERRSPGALASVGRAVEVRVTLDRDLDRGARSTTGTLTAVADVPALRVPVRIVPDVRADDGLGRLAAGTAISGAASVEPDAPGAPTAFVVFLRGSVQARPPDGLLGATDRVRQSFVAVTADLPEPGAALLRGLAIGDRSGLDPGTESAMEATALTHLTAVSGETVRNRGASRALDKCDHKRGRVS